MNNNVKRPCISCIYFNACGSKNRTMPCNGRVTKSQKAKEELRCTIQRNGTLI